MAAPGQGRAGISISVKLVLATSIVVAAAVGMSAWFSRGAISDLTEKQVAARRQAGERSIVRESELIVQAVANAVALPLSTGMDADVRPALEAAIKNDQASGDNRVQWFAVVDKTGAIHRTSGAPQDLGAIDRLLLDGVRNGDIVHARRGAGTDWVYGAPITLGGAAQGALRMGVSTEGLERLLKEDVAAAQERSQATRTRVVLVSLVVLAIGVLIAALYGISLARPIKALTGQAERIARGDLDSRVGTTRRDELGVLADTFDMMAGHIQTLLVEQAQKASLEKEMSLARQVQQAMLPPDALDQHGHFKVVGYCMPASSCGGDWWTYRKLSNNRMLLVVGDATGHGIHSAMIAATARGAVEALSGIDERLLTPEQVLRAIDSAIRQVGDHNVLMTAFAAVFDSANGVMHYANAGQNFPYVMKLGATRVLEQASIVAASGNPLGDRHIAVEIRRGSLQLRPGDLFVCFTDGVVERTNPAGKLFGDRRLRAVLTGQALPDDAALVRLRDQVVQSVERHADGLLAEDDITLVLCQ
ncbi:MAG TPA: SpoIIE family protein phosphatase, partial [Kofleriaceae bacterium]|nr:SpoIIE family protein phosphatase [Kofleriaceae bacterium]